MRTDCCDCLQRPASRTPANEPHVDRYQSLEGNMHSRRLQPHQREGRLACDPNSTAGEWPMQSESEPVGTISAFQTAMEPKESADSSLSCVDDDLKTELCAAVCWLGQR